MSSIFLVTITYSSFYPCSSVCSWDTYNLTILCCVTCVWVCISVSYLFINVFHLHCQFTKRQTITFFVLHMIVITLTSVIIIYIYAIKRLTKMYRTQSLTDLNRIKKPNELNWTVCKVVRSIGTLNIHNELTAKSTIF